MSWVRLDDRFRHHPKVLKVIQMVGAEGPLLWLCSLAYCADYMTDGHLPEASVPAIAPGITRLDDCVEALLNAGLWHRTADGYEVHDFLEWNPSAEEVKERRAQTINQRRQAGIRSGEARRNRTNEQTANESTNKQRTARSSPVHVLFEQTANKNEPHPVPIPEEKKEEAAESVDSASVRAVFDHWLEGWKRRIGRGRPPILTDQRKAKVRARLREGYSVADLKLACDGMWADDWEHRLKFADIGDHVCKSGATVEKWMLTGSERGSGVMRTSGRYEPMIATLQTVTANREGAVPAPEGLLEGLCDVG